MDSIGFKEWSLVCDALGRGDQCLILRKGGIAEGRDGFQFQHPEFYLFPTHFHEQSRLFGEADNADGEPDSGGDDEIITIRYFCNLAFTAVVTDWSTVEMLAPFHGWKEETVRERFEYKDEPGITLAVVRVRALSEPWSVAYERRFSGCRSWIEIPECPYEIGPPVVRDEPFDNLLEEIGSVVAGR